MNYSLTDLIAFMEREIETEKKADESYDTREAIQRQIIEQLARLRDLED
jgi:hypothetical protein